MHLNSRAYRLCLHVMEQAELLKISSVNVGGGQVIDFGVGVPGGLQAGLHLARICLGDLVEISITPCDSAQFGTSSSVTVHLDHPTLACLGGQYAGWPVQAGKYFAMGSGPMRQVRGREAVLDDLGLVVSAADKVVGVLETDQMPTAEVMEYIAHECRVATSQVIVCVAPVTSIAGVVQVVARSVETSLHKFHAMGMNPLVVQSALGTAPLAPMAKDMVGGIGRTNDAILYGGQVTLWVDTDQEQIDAIGPQIPSGASADHGRPFAEIFKSYDYDFYKVDPHLFSPAEVTFVNLRNGVSKSFGHLAPEVLHRSFGVSEKSTSRAMA